ncbi:thymidylate synthase [Priestia megaterium]|uniref:thymidylate synthase n=1 Tax=Priestia megaterium TaxID=1404 RepID=UPI00399C6F20
MSYGDLVYKEVIERVLEDGAWDTDAPVRTKWNSDGEPAYTKSVLNQQMIFDNSTEILNSILTQKRVPQKDPIREMFWIWQFKTNDVRFLREVLGCKVWNEWEREDGTIGRAYGWILRNKRRKVKITKQLLLMIENGEIRDARHCYNAFGAKIHPTHMMLDQVDYLIYMLKTNPHSRRIKTTLWSVDDLDYMALEPCVYETHWQLWEGKLHLTVNIRSNDLFLGNPYNVYQYSILHRLIAQVTGHQAGTICFNIDNAHIYDRHMDSVMEQISNKMHVAPEVWINPEVTSFYDFTVNDIKLIDYECEKTIGRVDIAV